MNESRFQKVHPYMIIRADGSPTGLRHSNVRCAARTVVYMGRESDHYVVEAGTGNTWDWADCAKITPNHYAYHTESVITWNGTSPHN